MILVKKTQAQVDRIKKWYYCKHCHEYVIRNDTPKDCSTCGSKLKIIYKEENNGK